MTSTNLRSGSSRSGSIVHDDKLTLDFRQRPTRADVGLTGDDSVRAYQRTGPMLDATVVLPTGTVHLPCFVVQAATDPAGGAITTPGAAPLAPKYFTLNRRFDSAGAAQDSLLTDAPVLGLDPHEVEFALGQLGKDAGTGSPQTRVLHGLVHDWLSVQVTVNDTDGGQVQAVYEIDIDVYHNPAVDKVIHGTTFPLDLRTRPDRAQLAFLDGYPGATVQPAWGRTLTAALTVPGGAVQIPFASVRSGAQNGSAPPDYTDINGRPGTVDAVRTRLLSQADALGLDRAAVAAAFTGPERQLHRSTLTGRATDVYDLVVKVEATPGQPGAFAASVTYQFTYR